MKTLFTYITYITLCAALFLITAPIYGNELTQHEPTVTPKEAKVIEQAMEAENNSPQKAIDILLLSITPKNSAALDFMLANIFYENSNFEQAKQYYTSALTKMPSFSRAKSNLVHTLLAQNNITEALKHIKQLLANPTATPSVYTLAGYAYLIAEETISAESAYRQALLLDNSDINAKTGLAQSLVTQGRYKEAMHIIKQALEKIPQNKNLWSVYANCAIATQKPEKAIAILETAKRLHAINTEGLLTLGDLYINCQNYQKAITSYELAFDKKTPSTARLLKCAQAFVMSGKTKQANVFLNRITTATAAENIQQQLIKAQIALNHNEPKQALEKYLSVLKNDPLNKQALMAAARLYQNQQNYPQALLFCDRVLALNPASADVLILKAQLEIELNHTDSAIMLLEQAISINPQKSVQQYLKQIKSLQKSKK